MVVREGWVGTVCGGVVWGSWLVLGLGELGVAARHFGRCALIVFGRIFLKAIGACMLVIHLNVFRF